MPDSILAALAGLCSAAVLEIMRYGLARSQKSADHAVDDATAFRQDLLTRIDALEGDVGTLAKERDEWQGKYYTEREARIKAEWQLESLQWIAQEHKPPAEEPAR